MSDALGRPHRCVSCDRSLAPGAGEDEVSYASDVFLLGVFHIDLPIWECGRCRTTTAQILDIAQEDL